MADRSTRAGSNSTPTVYGGRPVLAPGIRPRAASSLALSVTKQMQPPLHGFNDSRAAASPASPFIATSPRDASVAPLAPESAPASTNDNELEPVDLDELAEPLAAP